MYNFIVSIFLILILIIVLLKIYHVKIIFQFNSEEYPNFSFVIEWIFSTFKIIINKHANDTKLSFYLFNKRIFTKSIQKKKTNKRFNYNLLKGIELDYIKLKTSYGFEDPAITGMVCGAIDLISAYVNLKDLYNNPDFSMNSSYINIVAETKINVLSTFINILKSKIPNVSNKTLIGNK